LTEYFLKRDSNIGFVNKKYFVVFDRNVVVLIPKVVLPPKLSVELVHFCDKMCFNELLECGWQVFDLL
jgi:hypothetical protein